MATEVSTENVQNDPMEHFNRVTAQIEQTFSQLIDQLIGRKEFLLQKILQLKEDFRNKDLVRKFAMHELKKTQEELKQLNLEAKLISDRDSTRKIGDEGMARLDTSARQPSLYFKFSCPTREKIEMLIKNFGEFVETTNYSNMKEPILYRTGNFDRPTGLALDEANHKIYVVDHQNHRIQVFSFQAEFISKFGEDTLEHPFGITTTRDHLLITDNELHSMFRYDKNTFQLIDRAVAKKGEKDYLDDPRGVAVDTNGDIFIVDNTRWIVLIFSKQLEFLYTIGKGTLDYPIDVKLTAESVVVLNWSDKCINFFARSGELLRSCVSHDWGQGVFGGGGGYSVKNPYFFCLDRANNIIISDNGNHEIKVLDSSGKLVHTIGRHLVVSPMGIALSDAGNIYVLAAVDDDYVLLSF